MEFDFFTPPPPPPASTTTSTSFNTNNELRKRNPLSPTQHTPLVPPSTLQSQENINNAKDSQYSATTTATPNTSVDDPEYAKKMGQWSLPVNTFNHGLPFRWERLQSPANPFILIVLTALGIASRLWKIKAGSFVTWDEAHFGKFATYYLNHEYYHDVHPPLGKMLIALGGWLAGYTGDFDFGSGGHYGKKVPFVFMRSFVACFGALVVPMSYLASLQLHLSQTTSTMVALMCLFENGLIGISRLLLLDSFLVCFITMTFLSYAVFRNRASTPFSASWWTSLAWCGVSIGMVSSVKWVGFFITGHVGLMTIGELYGMMPALRANGRKAYRAFAGHFVARVICLIIIPVSIYLASFKMHFFLLSSSGTGDANMSSLFQAGLGGTELSEGPIHVAYGSIITLKSSAFGGGLLHSHPSTYPEGSKQQQITTYHHKDHNNEWIIVPSWRGRPDVAGKMLEWPIDAPIEYIQDSDVIRLIHNSTGRALHSHQIPAPINTKDWEVSAYGQMDYRDGNDLWQVEMVKNPTKNKEDAKRMHSLSTRFRLRHLGTGCYLKSRGNKLPEWGFKQDEVSCDYTPELDKRYLQWNVESHWNERLPPGDSSQYTSSFWEDFKDCNVGMYNTNNALTPDQELEPQILTSNAADWFWMSKGIRMSGWTDNVPKFYMLGNPVVWWTASLGIIGTLSLSLLYFLLDSRNKACGGGGGKSSIVPENLESFYHSVRMIVGAYAMTYLPFFVMGRVLYLHHYYPALVLSLINFGFLYDHLMGKRKVLKRILAVGIIAASAATFNYFSPMCYGITGPSRYFANSRKWLSSWNL